MTPLHVSVQLRNLYAGEHLGAVMSRGPGKWQRAILDALSEEGTGYVQLTHPGMRESDSTAILRAARTLAAKNEIHVSAQIVDGVQRLVASSIDGPAPHVHRVVGLDGKRYLVAGVPTKTELTYWDRVRAVQHLPISEAYEQANEGRYANAQTFREAAREHGITFPPIKAVRKHRAKHADMRERSLALLDTSLNTLTNIIDWDTATPEEMTEAIDRLTVTRDELTKLIRNLKKDR